MRLTQPAPTGRAAAEHAPPAVAGASRVAGRLDFIDALRGIAALSVVISHAFLLSGLSEATGLDSYIALGHAGVMLFFLCSGFVIPISLEGSGLRVFWVRRAFRLYPAYWASIAIVLALIPFGIVSVEPDALSYGLLPATLVNLTMVAELFGVPKLRGIFWTLTIEMVFYAVATVLFVLRVNRRSALIAATLLAGAAALELAIPWLTGLPAPHNLLFYLGLMFVGSCFYRQGAGALSRAGLAAVAGGAVAVAVVAWTQNGNTPVLVSWLAALAVFSASFALRGRAVPAALLVLGQVSYSLYLLHWTVFQLIGPVGPPALSVAIWAVASIGVAWVVYQVVERPAIDLGRRLSRR